MGEENYFYMQQAEGGLYTVDPNLQKYVSQVGQKLASVSDRPNLPFAFVVLNNSVPNAWALPGGKIAINRGLLVELDCEDELAAVLAHEIVHSAARHSAQAIEKAVLMEAGILGLQQVLQDHKYEDTLVGTAALGATLVAFKYSRSAELQADQYGIKYMQAAGYDPQAAVTLQEKFVKLSEDKDTPWLFGLFATHPPSEQRVLANEKTVAEYPPGGKKGCAEYQEAIAPLIKDKPAYEDLDGGYKALLSKQYKQAYDLAVSGIAIEPKEPHLYNLKGKAEVELREYNDALASFTQAIDLYPDYFDYYLQRGRLEYKMGDYTLAKLDLDKSNELLPSADAYYFLGQVALKEGNNSLAQQYFSYAAQANNASGQAARTQLGKMQGSSESPLSVQPSCRGGHHLKMLITNNSHVPIRNIEMQVEFFDYKQRLISKETLVIYETIPPFGSIKKTTSIRCPKEATSSHTVITRYTKEPSKK